MNKLSLGMPTLIEMPDIARCASFCVENGLQFVELNMNLPEYQLDRIDEDAIAIALQDHGIYCTLHLDENLNVCDFNPLVSKAYRRTVLQAIQIAKRHEMPIINMHLHGGVHFKLPGRKVFLFEKYENEYMHSLRIFRDLCENAIGDNPLKICVENTDGFAEYEQRGIALLLESTAFALTLDIGHNYCAGDMDSAFYQAKTDRLCHMHIHDANSQTCHLPLGTGDLNIHNALALAIREKCRAVVEVKTVDGLLQSLPVLKSYISDL